MKWPLTAVSPSKDLILNIVYFFLGKFAQRSNLSKTEQIEDPQVFFDYLTSDEITVLDAILVSEKIMEIRYEYGDKFVQPNPRTNVVIATFTTAYARLQLYDELDTLGERALHYDTDSVIYLSHPGQPEPRLGNYISDLTYELGGEHITVFASGCSNNYGNKRISIYNALINSFGVLTDLDTPCKSIKHRTWLRKGINRYSKKL